MDIIDEENETVVTPALKKQRRQSKLCENLVVSRDWRDMWLWQRIIHDTIQSAVHTCFQKQIKPLIFCMNVCRAWRTELQPILLHRLRHLVQQTEPQIADLFSGVGQEDAKSFCNFLGTLNKPSSTSKEMITQCAFHMSGTQDSSGKLKSINLCTVTYPMNFFVSASERFRFMLTYATKFEKGEPAPEQLIVHEV